MPHLRDMLIIFDFGNNSKKRLLSPLDSATELEQDLFSASFLSSDRFTHITLTILFSIHSCIRVSEFWKDFSFHELFIVFILSSFISFFYVCWFYLFINKLLLYLFSFEKQGI